LVRFSYRVADPQKAQPLSDKKLEPYLADPKAGVKLVIPEVARGEVAPGDPARGGQIVLDGLLEQGAAGQARGSGRRGDREFPGRRPGGAVREIKLNFK
jgi:hypothetical protein